jgi:transcription factor SOX7/8/10/18 (SOX group E/F)
MYGNAYDPSQVPSWPPQQTPAGVDTSNLDGEEGDSSHRPPNAFILYSQAMRSSVRQENPALSNTEVSRLLGKMWKEVPGELKLGYKQKASKLQEELKRIHPGYTYRKARRKRALNELLTKSTQGANPMMFPPGDPTMATYQAAMGGMYPGMAQFQGQNPAAIPGMFQGMPQLGRAQGLPAGLPQGIGQMQGLPQMPGMAFRKS